MTLSRDVDGSILILSFLNRRYLRPRSTLKFLLRHSFFSIPNLPSKVKKINPTSNFDQKSFIRVRLNITLFLRKNIDKQLLRQSSILTQEEPIKALIWFLLCRVKYIG